VPDWHSCPTHDPSQGQAYRRRLPFASARRLRLVEHRSCQHEVCQIPILNTSATSCRNRSVPYGCNKSRASKIAWTRYSVDLHYTMDRLKALRQRSLWPTLRSASHCTKSEHLRHRAAPLHHQAFLVRCLGSRYMAHWVRCHSQHHSWGVHPSIHRHRRRRSLVQALYPLRPLLSRLLHTIILQSRRSAQTCYRSSTQSQMSLSNQSVRSRRRCHIAMLLRHRQHSQALRHPRRNQAYQLGVKCSANRRCHNRNSNDRRSHNRGNPKGLRRLLSSKNQTQSLRR